MPRRGAASTLLACGIVAGYALLLAWFRQVDFYRQHFFDHGLIVPAYMLMRLLFVPYCMWMVYATGVAASVAVAGRKALGTLAPPERYLLCFLIGAGVGHAVLFPVGFAGLYTYPLAVMLTMVIMIFSVPHMTACLRGAGAAIPPAWAALRASRPAMGLAVGIVLAAIFYLTTRGLYPAGGHDYYNHYFPFLMRVLETGSTRPNDVWYQFYYSRGLGFYFIGMLLTDPLAPQLVTTGFIATGACLVFALTRGKQRSLLPWVGVLLYVLFYGYVYGIEGVTATWGEPQKDHELTAVLLLGLVWVASRLFEEKKLPARRIWLLALHATIIAVALITLELTLLVGLYMAAYTLWFAYRRAWRRALLPFAGGITTATLLLGLLALNYYYTGMPLEVGDALWWPYADLDKVAKWGVLFEVIDENARLSVIMNEMLPWPRFMEMLACYLRLELWWPLFVPPLVLLGYRVYSMRDASVRVSSAPLRALLWFTGVVVVLSLIGGRALAGGSFYRISSFSYGTTLCTALLLWRAALTEGKKQVPHLRFCAVILLLTAWCVAVAAMPLGRKWRLPEGIARVVSNTEQLWSGEFSLKDAYSRSIGWPRMYPDVGISPDMEQVWRLVGPHTRIWSMQVYNYCMLPGCNLQSFKSFRFSPSWQKIYFGTPGEAEKALKAEGLNYFYFSGQFPSTEDPLPYAPLFSPEHIGQYLAVRWTDGDRWLLTWRGSAGTAPVDEHFLKPYRRMVKGMKQCTQCTSFFIAQWPRVVQEINRQGSHLHPFCLPWDKSCNPGQKP